MKKALVCISNFGTGQMHYLHRSLEEYNRMARFQIQVVLHTTVPVDVDGYSFATKQEAFDPSIGFDLAMQHRRLMIEQQDDYDLFIYAENDILIREDNLLAFCEASEHLPLPYAVGFIRYEFFKGDPPDDAMYFPDAHPECGAVYDGQVTVSGLRCIKLANRHQGCFVLTRAQLKAAMHSPHFNFYFPQDPLNREIGASFVYIACGIQRVIPLEYIDRLMIHHLADKYVNLDEPPWNKVRPHSLASLKKLFDEAR